MRVWLSGGVLYADVDDGVFSLSLPVPAGVQPTGSWEVALIGATSGTDSAPSSVYVTNLTVSGTGVPPTPPSPPLVPPPPPLAPLTERLATGFGSTPAGLTLHGSASVSDGRLALMGRAISYDFGWAIAHAPLGHELLVSLRMKWSTHDNNIIAGGLTVAFFDAAACGTPSGECPVAPAAVSKVLDMGSPGHFFGWPEDVACVVWTFAPCAGGTNHGQVCTIEGRTYLSYRDANRNVGSTSSVYHPCD